jgi:hypothetical protein
MANKTTKSKMEQPSAEDITTGFVGVLSKTVDKLTSQIFLFLIAYAILLVCGAIWAPSMPVELRAAFCGLPALGLAAYVFFERRKLSKVAESHGIKVQSGIATDEALIIGVKGSNAPSGDVVVSAGYASGKAKIIGQDSSSGSEAYLIEICRTLNDARRAELVSAAITLQQQEEHASRTRQ